MGCTCVSHLALRCFWKRIRPWWVSSLICCRWLWIEDEFREAVWFALINSTHFFFLGHEGSALMLKGVRVGLISSWSFFLLMKRKLLTAMGLNATGSSRLKQAEDCGSGWAS